MTIPPKTAAVTHAPTYNPVNWYWSVPTVVGFVFSSWRALWVPTTDATYGAWLASGGVTTVEPTTAALAALLTAAGETQAAASAAYDPTSLAAQQQEALAQIASVRYAMVASGVTINGFQFATDLEARANWDSIYLAALGNSALTIQWKLSTGTFLPLNATQIIAIGQALLGFVQAAFTNEQALQTQINAASTIQGVRAVDLTSGWPSPVLTISTQL